MTTIYDFVVSDATGQPHPLAQYKDRVLLIVNVASRCGFTAQYAGLQTLHHKYHAQGLSILGFPCNQFGGQEPDDDAAIQTFCSTTFNVTFPVLAKIDVNGEHTAPLYQYLKHAQSGLLGSEAIKWNFTKFLVNRQGEVIDRIASVTTPESLESDIVALL
jgi:glutathione peroxidase